METLNLNGNGEPKKSARALWITLAVCAVILIGIAAAIQQSNRDYERYQADQDAKSKAPAIVTDPPEGTPRYSVTPFPPSSPASPSMPTDGQLRDLNRINESNLKALQDMNNGNIGGGIDHALDSTRMLDDYYRTYGK